MSNQPIDMDLVNTNMFHDPLPESFFKVGKRVDIRLFEETKSAANTVFKNIWRKFGKGEDKVYTDLGCNAAKLYDAKRKADKIKFSREVRKCLMKIFELELPQINTAGSRFLLTALKRYPSECIKRAAVNYLAENMAFAVNGPFHGELFFEGDTFGHYISYSVHYGLAENAPKSYMNLCKMAKEGKTVNPNLLRKKTLTRLKTRGFKSRMPFGGFKKPEGGFKAPKAERLRLKIRKFFPL